MAKDVPKRLGEMVDAICAECGIKTRIVPRAPALHKREALTILAAVQTWKAEARGQGEGDK